jgi:hypothetical protein
MSSSSLLCSSSKKGKIIKEWLRILTKKMKKIYENLVTILFQFILNIILYSIIIIKQIRIYFNEKVRKKSSKDINNNDDNNDNVGSPTNFPKHVCFIINEKLSLENFNNACMCMVSTFASFGVGLFTIYTFDGKFVVFGWKKTKRLIYLS